MSLEKISNSTLEEALVSRLPLRPTAVSRYGAAMTGEEVRAAFDRSAKLLAERLNQVIGYLTGEDEGVGSLPFGEDTTLGEVLAALRADVDEMASLVLSIPERLAIPAGAVTEDKLANGAVTGTKLASGAVTSAKLATNAVTVDKIATAAVRGYNIAEAVVSEGKLASGAVTTAKLADGAVTKAKLADGAVTLTKLNTAETDRRYARRVSGKNRILATSNQTDDSGWATPLSLAYAVKDTGESELKNSVALRDENGCVWLEDPALHPLTADELALTGGDDHRGVPKAYVDRLLKNYGLQKSIEVLSGQKVINTEISLRETTSNSTLGTALTGYSNFWFAGKYWKAGISYTVYSNCRFCYYNYLDDKVLAVAEAYGDGYRLTVVPTAGSPGVQHPYCDLAFAVMDGLVAYYVAETLDPVEITPVHNTEYRVGVCKSLTLSIAAPKIADEQSAFDLVYSPKNAPLTLDGDPVLFHGDSVTDGTFTPEEGYRYHVAFRYDGTAMTALVTAFAEAEESTT